MERFEVHPLAEIFPLMEGRPFDELVDDIAKHGVREPVVLYHGKLLDGRNRVRAAEICKAAVTTKDFDGEDPLAYVVSANLRRRHLRDSQRALIAARLSTRERGRPSATHRSVSREEASDLLNVRLASLDRAKLAHKCASQAVLKLVESGKVSCAAAAGVSHLSKNLQDELAAKGASAIAAASRTRGSSGRSGRNHYSQLYAIVDEICAALERRRLDTADLAASKLRKKIAEVVAQDRAAR